MPELFLKQIFFLKETNYLNEYDPILAGKVGDEKDDENDSKQLDSIAYVDLSGNVI
jgi:hypothetical protein